MNFRTIRFLLVLSILTKLSVACFAQQRPAPFFHAVDNTLAPGQVPTIIASAGYNLLRASDSTMLYSTGLSWVEYKTGATDPALEIIVLPGQDICDALANLQDGGAIVFAPGVHTVVEKCVITQRKISFKGYGPSTIFRAYTSVDTAFVFRDADSSEVAYFRVEAADLLNVPLKFNNTDFSFIHHIQIDSAAINGMRFDGPPGAKDNIVSDVIINQSGGDGLVVYVSDNNFFHNIRVYFSQGSGIRLVQSDEVIFSDCDVNQNVQYGVYASSPETPIYGGQINGGRFTSSGQHNILLQNAKLWQIQNALIKSAGTSAASTYSGVALDGSDNNMIVGNQFYDYKDTFLADQTLFGVTINATSDTNFVSENHFQYQTLTGINDAGTQNRYPINFYGYRAHFTLKREDRFYFNSFNSTDNFVFNTNQLALLIGGQQVMDWDTSLVRVNKEFQLNTDNPTLTLEGGIGWKPDHFSASHGGIKVHDGTGAVILTGVQEGDSYSAGDVLTIGAAGTITWETPSASGAPVGSAFVTVGNDGTLTAERALTGTPNRITVTDNGANSTIVLSTPQDLHTAANVTFNQVTAGTFVLDDNQKIELSGAADDEEIGWNTTEIFFNTAGTTRFGIADAVVRMTVPLQLWADATAATGTSAGRMTFDTNILGASVGAAKLYDGTRVTVLASYAETDLPSDGQALIYNATSDIWETTTLSSGAPIGSAYVTAGSDGTLTAERALTGTSNRITVTDNGANSTIVLSTPQDLHTSANVQFNQVISTAFVLDDNQKIELSGAADDEEIGWNTTEIFFNTAGTTRFGIADAVVRTTVPFQLWADATAATGTNTGRMTFDTNILGASVGAIKVYDGTRVTVVASYAEGDLPVEGDILVYNATSDIWETTAPSASGAPTNADYLVGTANGSLSAEIVVGTSPGGELGGTWASPTIDADAVSIDEIGDAATDATIAMGAHELNLTSTIDAANEAVLTILNTDADAVNNNSLLELMHNDGADANVFYARMIGDADGTPVTDYSLSQTAFNIGSGITTTFSSTVQATAFVLDDNQKIELSGIADDEEIGWNTSEIFFNTGGTTRFGIADAFVRTTVPFRLWADATAATGTTAGSTTFDTNILGASVGAVKVYDGTRVTVLASYAEGDLPNDGDVLAYDGTADIWVTIPTDLHDPVTLAGTPNYLTLSGQEITLTKLDLVDDLNTFTSANLAINLTDESGAAGVFPRFSLTTVAQGHIIYYNGTSWVNLAPGSVGQVLHTNGAGANPSWDTDDTGGGGAPTDVNYLVGTANGTLTNEIVVGTTPGGELGGTWGSPTIDADAVSIDEIGDAAGDATIAMGAHELDITSTIDAANEAVLTITNTDADAANNNSFIELKHNDGGDVNVFYMRMIGDNDGTPVTDYSLSQTAFNIGSAITTTFGASVQATAFVLEDNQKIELSGIADDEEIGWNTSEIFFNTAATTRFGIADAFVRTTVPFRLWADATAATGTTAGSTTFDTNILDTSVGAVKVYDGSKVTVLASYAESDLPANGNLLVYSTTTDVWETTNSVSGLTITGANDAGGASSFEIPNSSAPTTDATGEIALDDNFAATNNGEIQFYSGSAVGNKVVVAYQASLGEPGNLNILRYDATNSQWLFTTESNNSGFHDTGSLVDLIDNSDRVQVLSSSGLAAFEAVTSSAGTGTLQRPLKVEKVTTTNTASAGVGVGMTYSLQRNSFAAVDVAYLDYVSTNVTETAYEGYMTFSIADAGTVTERFRLHNDLSILSSPLQIDNTGEALGEGVTWSNYKLQTTDATTTTIATILIGEGTTTLLKATIVAVNSDGSSNAYYIISAAYENIDAGSAEIVGSAATIASAEDVGGWGASFSNSGGNALIQVTGAASTTIQWQCTVEKHVINN